LTTGSIVAGMTVYAWRESTRSPTDTARISEEKLDNISFPVGIAAQRNFVDEIPYNWHNDLCFSLTFRSFKCSA
jgi:hypothetical protein